MFWPGKQNLVCVCVKFTNKKIEKLNLVAEPAEGSKYVSVTLHTK
jgi:hypothetical protein